MTKHRSTSKPRPWTWFAGGLVVVGLLIAVASLQGLFSSSPAPGEYVPPAAIDTSTRTASPQASTAPPTPSETATDSSTQPPTSDPTSGAADSPTTGTDLSAAGVLSPAGAPVRVEVHRANGQELVNASLQRAFLDADGILAPPHGVAGWYAESGWAKPGWPGASIIAGHVRGSGSPDVFWNIPQARRGDIVTVTYDSGQVSRFRVTRSEAMHKNDVPRDDSIWDHASATPKLSLITCDPATPTRSDGHLEGNWVLWAVPLSSA